MGENALFMNCSVPCPETCQRKLIMHRKKSVNHHTTGMFQLVGVSQGCLDHTVPYLLERQQFGKPIFEFQVDLSVLVIYTAGSK